MQEALLEIERRAMKLLVLREHSRQELHLKLLQRGYVSSHIALVVESLAKKKLQSDERFAEAYVHSRCVRGYGPERICMELQQKGVADELIHAAVNSEDQLWHEAALRVYQKKFGKSAPTTFQEKIKRQQFMRYRGFDSRHAKLLSED